MNHSQFRLNNSYSIGVVLSGVVVSMIASVLIEALSPKVLNLRGQRVALLHGSEESKYAFRRQAVVHEFEEVHFFIFIRHLN